MCGIAGYIGEIKNPSDCLTKMAQAINHRGPDSNGL
jgi:asparagine synthetase B (glutamine-hydrolysing)